ncbi:MAG: periplasmic heavy metal sensor [Pseudomonadota bacterium]
MNSRILLIGLAVSIGINLILIGMFAGAAMRPEPPPPALTETTAGGSSERVLARALIASAPQSDRRAIRQDLRRSWQETAPQRQRVERAKIQVANALRAAPYDEDRTIAAFSELSEAEAELKIIIRTNLARRLSETSQETRNRIVQNLERRGQRRERFRRER